MTKYFIKATSSTVAPPGPNPVDVFTKSAYHSHQHEVHRRQTHTRASTERIHASAISSLVNAPHSRITLTFTGLPDERAAYANE